MRQKTASTPSDPLFSPNRRRLRESMRCLSHFSLCGPGGHPSSLHEHIGEELEFTHLKTKKTGEQKSHLNDVRQRVPPIKHHNQTRQESQCQARFCCGSGRRGSRVHFPQHDFHLSHDSPTIKKWYPRTREIGEPHVLLKLKHLWPMGVIQYYFP